MKRLQIGVVTFAIVTGMLAVSCDKESSGVTQYINVGKLGVNPQVSECGGFAAESKMLSLQQTQNAQCSDERLIWQYDSQSQLVTFLNKDAWLNCCGDHSITITGDKTTGKYVIREVDAPGKSRCHCMCFFDFSVGLSNMLPELINVELYRHITDEGPEKMIWQGTLDLNQGEGEIVLEENIGWCE